MPDGIGKENRACLSLSDYKKILSALPTKRDQIIVKLFYMGGLRRGELFSIRWKNFNGSCIFVLRQINRFGHEADVKTQASEGNVALPKDVCADLAEWRRLCADNTPDAFMFASKSGTPMEPQELAGSGPTTGRREGGNPTDHIPHVPSRARNRGSPTWDRG